MARLAGIVDHGFAGSSRRHAQATTSTSGRKMSDAAML
jgi:hypothetical protein